MFAIIKNGVVSYISFDIVIPQDGENILEFENIESPFFDGEKIVESEKIIPEKTNMELNIDIGYKITQDVFGGNPYAQIADLAKAQVTTLALLVPILGKEVVAGAYADLIVTVKKVSESRVKQGLSAYDLSFLD